MREAYSDQLDAVRSELVEMSRLVGVAVAEATSALLNGDAKLAEQVISEDVKIDALRVQLEEECFQLIALQQPVASDLRQLIAGLRMVTEFERMGDLAVHVAKIARLRTPERAVPDSAIPTVSRMASIAEVMVGKVGHVIADSDVEAARDLEQVDSEMDKLRRTSFEELLGSDWKHGVEPAVDIALLGRYYERIADHAVSIARRVVYLVTGENPHSLN